MTETFEYETSCLINSSNLKDLKIEFLNSEYTVALTDMHGDEHLEGYSNTIEDAINDLHQGLM